ncbi:hypothetical protein [Hoylesella saccharolytica]|uniref:hypothetical protein n=1 Tax=Hoylesella saccharolytica TaxID=633701 RepID=UPI0028D01F34|nr:hypothetical protein [Hoylesella saccharolytica]
MVYQDMKYSISRYQIRYIKISNRQYEDIKSAISCHQLNIAAALSRYYRAIIHTDEQPHPIDILPEQRSRHGCQP